MTESPIYSPACHLSIIDVQEIYQVLTLEERAGDFDKIDDSDQEFLFFDHLCDVMRNLPIRTEGGLGNGKIKSGCNIEENVGITLNEFNIVVDNPNIVVSRKYIRLC